MQKVSALLLLVTCYSLFAISPAHAYVNPGAPKGFVNDFAGMLAPQERTLLDAKLSSFALETKHEISVVTIPSLGGDTVENFAEKLFGNWGIGKAGADNGVLLLIARDDRKMRIEVGYGLEPVLTDALSSQIIRNILTPAFKTGDFYGGIDAATSEMIKAAQGEVVSVPNSGGNRNEEGSWGDWLWIILFAPIWLGSILGRSKSWWLGGVLGGVAGLVVGVVYGFLYAGIIAVIFFIPLGLLFDYFVSNAYTRSVASGLRPPWWIGGGRGGHGGGGFGGFGGGSSGGGGASGGW